MNYTRIKELEKELKHYTTLRDNADDLVAIKNYDLLIKGILKEIRDSYK